MKNKYAEIDNNISGFMQRYGTLFLRISVGIVFFWFGILKFFPNVSPAQEIVTKTMSVLSFGLLSNSLSLIILAIWEVIIGLGLIIGKYLRFILFLLFAQMLGTLTPLVLFPSETFMIFPIVPTMEGQYIIKNLILISAGLVVGGTVGTNNSKK